MSQQTTSILVVVALVSAFCNPIAGAQITETKLIASDGASQDYFGNSVSISGDYAIVGAKDDDNDNGSDAGAAYIFHWDGANWVEQAKLTPSDGREGDHFGFSVSLSGSYALVGAYHDKIGGIWDAGSAYIFQLEGSNWLVRAKLIGDSTSGWFGYSVSLSGDLALVGARQDDDLGYGSGAAYVFRNDGTQWVRQTKLHASDGDFYGEFGGSVSISEDYAIVGAPHIGGSAYIFHYDGSTWIEQTKLTPNDGSLSEENFGCAVSLSGDYALIGAYTEGVDTAYSMGAAYIFHRDGPDWVKQARLIASDRAAFDYFGFSVSLSGDYALVGADGNGSAYIFHHGALGWVEQTQLISSDRAHGDYFGNSVSISGDYALVGAFRADISGTETGAAYIYSATPICSKVSQFQARCRPGGLIKARVTMADASHAGEIVEISIDDVPYEVTIDATGRGQLSQSGFSAGPHTVELTNPGQCFDPIVVTCRTSLDKESSDDWDDEPVSDVPTETALLGNYPNPFNPSTTIRYTLSVDSPVSIRVYNMLGQEVVTLVDGFQKAGEQSVTWHGVNNFGQAVASGLYIYRLQTSAAMMSQKMLFAK